MKALGIVLLVPALCVCVLAALMLGACHVLADHDLDEAQP